MNKIDNGLHRWESFFRRTLFLVLLAVTFLFTGFAASSGSRPGVPSRPDRQKIRALDAARQLRDHQHRLSVQSKSVSHRGVMNQKAAIGFGFDKVLQTTSTVFFFDDAEQGVNGWTTQSFGDSTLWHQTTLDANTPTHSWWCGIDSQQNYNTGRRVRQALISPSIDLTGASGSVSMMFTENYFTEAGWDFCMVDVSTDSGATWTQLRGGYGTSPSGDSYGWKITTLNLSPYVGNHINIRFYFDTGDSIFNKFSGWFVDNIAVFDQAGTIAGTVYLDMNHNGSHDAGEEGIEEGLISVTGPMSLTTRPSSDGTFRIPLPLGSYQITEALDSPWVLTTAPATWNVSLTLSGQLIEAVDFGDYRSGTILRGIVFDDINRDSLMENSDSLLTGWTISARDSEDNLITSGVSVDSGQFNLFVTDTGLYHLQEYPPYSWVSTLPGGYPAQYLVDVTRLDTVLGGYLFGNYKLSVGSIRGTVFNDTNRNGIWDHTERGLLSWFISVDNSIPVAATDSSGNYQINNIPVGNHSVYLYQRPGWKQSFPATSYSIVVDSGETVDSVNFGVYALRPGSISGYVFNDLNKNAVRDSGEPGLAGYAIHLGGSALASVVTDDSGRYTFGGLYSGIYTDRLVISSHWRQTYPPNLQGYSITLGDEQSRDSLNFALVPDSTFNLAYRTFLPESIAYAKDNTGRQGKSVKVKAYASQATFTLIAPTGGLAGIHVEFSQSVDPATLTVTHFPPPTHDSKFKKWEFNLVNPDTLVMSEHVIIFARGNLGQPLYIKKYWWEPAGVLPPHWKPNVISNTPGVGQVLYPMPDIVNVLDNTFMIGVPAPGIVVGVYGPHSVYHTNSQDILKSLIDRHGLHLGPPRCLGVFANNLQQIRHPVHTLPPTKGNNILFAEALALKVNIQASNFGLIPFGLGDLIFQDTAANPLNGLSVRRISTKLDTLLSGFDAVHDTCTCDTTTFKGYYKTIRMIDSAFSGPMDTISFATGLNIAPARALAAVPFLHLDSSFATIAATLQRPAKMPELPKQFVLEQNYPNPFNPSTTIEFYLTSPSIVTMKLYNTLGQEIATLLDRQSLEDGWNQYTMSADAFRLASGVYYYRLVVESAGDQNAAAGQKVSMVKKMLYLK